MPGAVSGFRAYVIVWSGQFASLLGSNLTGFALGVYVYQSTGSATTLSLVFALAVLPSIAASPVAGALVDRWGSRRALVVSNTGAMLVSAVLAALLITDSFAVWQVFPIVVAMSTLSALEVPAFGSLAPRLVPSQHIGRANGMRMFALAASEVLAPVSAGFLLLAIDISGIVLVDLVTFGVALATLAAVKVPHSGRPAQSSAAGITALLTEFRDGWRYVAARRGLVALLFFLCAINFSAGFIDLLITPLVLSFASAGQLGTVLSIGGLGMIIASVAVSVWGGPRRRVRGILGFSLGLTVATVVGSARPNVALVSVGAFLFMGALGVIVTSNQSIWQCKVEPSMLGRSMALVNMVSSVPQLVAYLLAGPAVDVVVEPLVGHDHVKSAELATVIGDGPGRGIALLLMIMGLLISVSVAIAARNARLRGLEDELPDVAESDDSLETGADHLEEFRRRVEKPVMSAGE